MFQSRSQQQAAVLLGVAGGMLVVASGFVAAYFVLGGEHEARAATLPPAGQVATPAPGVPAVAAVSPQAQRAEASAPPAELAGYLRREVELVTARGSVTRTWADLGAVIDSDEAGARGELTALAARGSLPIRIDRDKAARELLAIKASHDLSPVNAYLDLEGRKIHEEKPGKGLDVWASLPRLQAAAREGAGKLELVHVALPAAITRASLGIDDISSVLGHYLTKFPVNERDRTFNLKLAASKLNGAVLKPGEEWSFNTTVGERAEKEGYKIAHVITAGEMVDGLAGGTCQISTTLFGAAFFAGIDIVKTINHSRPSAYTPLGFDATVVWPNVDLKLKNPYEFPVVVHFRVAAGEAQVEILGKPRPYDKIVFERRVLESTPFATEERLDDDMPLDTTSIDQAGFNGYKIERVRKFYKGKELVKTNKWTLDYRPVTEYVRRGRNPDPDAKPPREQKVTRLQEPKSAEFRMAQ